RTPRLSASRTTAGILCVLTCGRSRSGARAIRSIASRLRRTMPRSITSDGLKKSEQSLSLDQVSIDNHPFGKEVGPPRPPRLGSFGDGAREWGVSRLGRAAGFVRGTRPSPTTARSRTERRETGAGFVRGDHLDGH